jgi:DUF1680 family protein
MKSMAIRFVHLACLFILAAVVSAREKAPAPIGYPLTPLLLSDVKLDEGFWADRMKTHVEVTIPHVLKTLGIDYADPKPGRSALALARTLEGVSYVLMMEDHKDLRSMMEKICVNIGRATNEDNRWFGAVAEAPALFSLVTGKENEWLKAALKEYRQREGEHFGKDGSFIKEPESHAYYGMAIISLYQATGDEYYRKLARKFMDIRGMPATGQRTWPKFAAQHKPVEEMKEPGGHAGSFGWFAAALVDVGALSGEKKYGDAAVRIWKDMVDTRMCITGGTGAVSKWEGFGEPYKFGRGGYNETCAASGQVFYNYRLGMLMQDGRYFDTMEAVLFNGFLSGVSLSGNRFFYTNILESGGHATRQEDRRVPCCHGSVARTIPQVPGYMYAHTDKDIYVPLYASNSTTVPLSGGRVRVEQETLYPFEGKVRITLQPAKTGQKFGLRLRIPTWAREKFMPGALYSFVEPPTEKWSIQVNGKPVESTLQKGFALVERSWNPGDKVELNLPMPVRFSTCIDKVEANQGRLAVTRGPLVFCAEEVDNNGPVRRFSIPVVPAEDRVIVSTIKDGVLKGMPMIRVPGVEKVDDKERPIAIKLVPYFSWENRGAKSMSVWISQGEDEDAAPIKWHVAKGFKGIPRSRPGPQTEMILENHSGRELKLYWISYRGKRQAYGRIKPGETRPQGTYANSTWVVTDENDKPLGYFIAGHQVSRALIPTQ